MGTRWSTSGPGQWIQYDLGQSAEIGAVSIAFYSGNRRSAIFELQISQDSNTWQTVYSGQSSGASVDYEMFEFDAVEGRYVRFVGEGNSVNAWNSITEFSIHPPEASLSHLQLLTESHISEAAIRQPLSVQLANSLQQIEHHYERGALPQALTHLERYMRHLNNEPLMKHIDEEVHQQLNGVAEALRVVWME